MVAGIASTAVPAQGDRVWRTKASVSVLLAAFVLAACSMAEPARTPAPPAGAERLADWSVFDQARADQLRRGLTELDRRFPAGEAMETQLWRLPASTTWPQVQSHYGHQLGWQADPKRLASAGPLVPDAQVYLDAAESTQLIVAWFSGTPDGVLVVQRARTAN